MQGFAWLGALVIGGLAGWIAATVTEARTGIIANIILGIVGAVMLNAVLLATIGATDYGWIGQLVVGAVGAIVLIFLYRVALGRNPPDTAQGK